MSASFYDTWVDSLTVEQLRDELKSLQIRYTERANAMFDTATVVRSLYLCSTCGKKILIIGEGRCHCPGSVRRPKEEQEPEEDKQYRETGI